MSRSTFRLGLRLECGLGLGVRVGVRVEVGVRVGVGIKVGVRYPCVACAVDSIRLDGMADNHPFDS